MKVLLPFLALVLLLTVAMHHQNDQPGRPLRQRRLSGDTATSASALDEIMADASAWDWTAVSNASGITPPCRWQTFAPPGSLQRENASICLRAHKDLLADAIRGRGFWPECADLPAMLGISAGAATDSAAAPPLFLDVGANVGACSLHMLLTTGAHVVAFEPGADNVAYASQTFLRLADGAGGDSGVLPDARRRLLLLRTGLGRKPTAELLHQAVGNAGHAVIGLKVAQFAPLGHVPAQRVTVRRLDDVLWPAARRALGQSPPVVALLKLECAPRQAVNERVGLERLWDGPRTRGHRSARARAMHATSAPCS